MSAQSTTASSSHYMKLCEAPALFSGVRAKLTRWLKDVEDFYKLEKVLDLDKVLVAKNRMSQDFKEWFNLYEVENGPFQNWESLKAALIEHYSDTLATQKARKDLKKCRCTGAGVDDYNKRFKPLVMKLKGWLIKEDIVKDYISGLPADIRLETNKAHPVNLVIAMKTASELEVFLSGEEGPRGGTRDFQRPRVPSRVVERVLDATLHWNKRKGPSPWTCVGSVNSHHHSHQQRGLSALQREGVSDAKEKFFKMVSNTQTVSKIMKYLHIF
uniref:Ty3 transposon capsid-like protein domain-containing protein n=1 Tax=Chromera velia CCMP2878 TaxID=1169474 RepID=A0A0G4I2V9_9ALVE|eukprot:Cvel_10443.t1-p1 / transcript=Cvel_10443.t1 / gene=Cvel_10443 / organism=Chromera_velia_CCMP2878 / gene_product=hypothetical protein / transcript_product=hypothetical protein / location=Cvel_scaffold629:15336-16145(-) / protein_length=270 / sequence_SO=supercontig / SO=protein_coding / is_pseudo=false